MKTEKYNKNNKYEQREILTEADVFFNEKEKRRKKIKNKKEKKNQKWKDWD